MDELKVQDLKVLLLNEIENYKLGNIEVHPYDLAKELEKLRDLDEKEYEYICKKIPSELFAQMLCEMPSYVQEEISDVISDKKIANITSKMDSDDASELIRIKPSK